MSEQTAETVVAQEMDLRGTPCPMNWVKAKLVLEEMAPGEVLALLLDDGDPIRNVPRSIRTEGHRVVQATAHEGYVRLLVARGEG